MVVYKALYYWGAFFIVYCFSSLAFASESAFCPAKDDFLGKVELTRVHDGDSLKLADGRSIRVIGINAPEVAMPGRRAEPLSDEARHAAMAFLRDSEIYLRLGRQTQDKYGRWLGHIYRRNGDSLAAWLLHLGLAAHIAIAPNLEDWQCLQQQEDRARLLRKGIWRHPYYQVRDVSQLTRKDTGFRVIRGLVQGVSLGRNGSWWIDVGKDLALQIPQSAKVYFDRRWLLDLPHKSIEARGWLIDRKMRHGDGHNRWLISLKHHSAVKLLVSDKK